MVKGKVIILGVTGSIAAYKAAEITSKLRQEGAEIHVVMTKNASEFINPLTFRVLSGNRVIRDMFQEPQEFEVQHVGLADRADLVLVAPATANFIAKIAAGISDDMLTALVCATRAPVLIAPAMNTKMWENPVTQGNVEKLRHLGYKLVEPEYGWLACGYEGKGRLAALETIFEAVYELLSEKDLQGLSILVTAGPTCEFLDPLRFISNPSSGKMGYAIAQAAKRRGAKVTLVSGPTHLVPPSGINYIKVQRAEEMYQAVLKNFPSADVVIKAAAVSDFRPEKVATEKIKKEIGEFSVKLVRNPDILLELGKRKGDKILVGFAAESEDLEENAKRKLKEKNLDLIVANDISIPGVGLGAETNIVKLIDAQGKAEDLPEMPKKELAEIILDRVKKLKEERR